MEAGYVLDFRDRTFREFFLETTGVEIHSEKYSVKGTSKAKKLREFWMVEPDHMVGKLLIGLIDYSAKLETKQTPEAKTLRDQCRQIATRLLVGAPSLDHLKQQARVLNANHLAEQIRRLEESVEKDPSLAIGTAKELIETCCKTILAERGKSVSGTPEMSNLTKDTMRELKLVPDGVQDAVRGADVIKRLLNNIGSIGNSLAELRNLYGTGHGKEGNAAGLSVRHAKLAVGVAASLTVFFFETHQQTKS
jgi:hypothetical protein